MMISVVIPTCERPDSLAECISKLGDADEIVVSDDSRSDEIRELIARRFSAVKWVRGPGRGPAANRNCGARHANGDWIAFIDDDCVPDVDWLRNMRRAAFDLDIVEGRTICPNRTYHPFEEVVENLTGGLLWSCNFGIRRDLFQQLGGFDEDFLEAGGEDLEFAWRIKQNGSRVHFAPEVLVYHPARRLRVTNCIYRVFQSKWHLLYRLKVTHVRCATCHELMDLLRVTKRAVFDGKRNSHFVVRLLLQWILLPILLPYLIYCEITFRRDLSKRRPSFEGYSA
jgi:glycosyltransferase involved in cell wall biosynthesis